MRKTQKALKPYFEYLAAGVSPFHAVQASAKLLCAAGFAPLEEGAAWSLAPGGRYYTARNGSSLIAWRMPEEPLTGWRMCAAHSDSPTFRLTKLAGGDKLYSRACTEGYGGMRLSTWLDRPLTLAGRVLVRTEHGIETRLYAPDRDLLCIPSLCVHFDRDGAKPLNPAVDLQPVFGSAGENLEDLLRQELHGDILGFDLTLAVRQQPTVVGLRDEFYMAPRIDDLGSAYATLQGFLDGGTPAPGCCNVWCLFDNEEVGSGTRQGAMGDFLPSVMARIEEAQSLTADRRGAARANSLLLSADNAHATHPNHPEMSDAEHPVALNGGVVLKYNASQRYTTSGLTGALFTELCRRADVPVQVFYNRPDVAGGSTLGNLLGRQVSIPMADIGLPQLSMHSAVETGGCADAASMTKAAKALYTARFRCTGGANENYSCFDPDAGECWVFED